MYTHPHLSSLVPQVRAVRVLLSARDGDEHRVVGGLVLEVHLLHDAVQGRVAPSDVEDLVPLIEDLAKKITKHTTAKKMNRRERVKTDNSWPNYAERMGYQGSENERRVFYPMSWCRP